MSWAGLRSGADHGAIRFSRNPRARLAREAGRRCARGRWCGGRAIERILVPPDGTAGSAAALEEIVQLASDAAVEIIVAHVHQERALPAFSDHLAHEVRAWSEESIARNCPSALDATARAARRRAARACARHLAASRGPSRSNVIAASGVRAARASPDRLSASLPKRHADIVTRTLPCCSSSENPVLPDAL
jgi:hypothetical protein